MKTKEILVLLGFAGGAFYLLNSQAVQRVLPRRIVAAGSTPAPSTANAVNQVLGAITAPFGGYLPVPFSGGDTVMGVNKTVPFWNDFSFVKVK